MKNMKFVPALLSLVFALSFCGALLPEWKAWLNEYSSLAKQYCIMLEKASPANKNLDNTLAELETQMKALDDKLVEKRPTLKIEEQKELDDSLAAIKGELITAKGNQIMKLFEGLIGGPLGNATNNPIIDAVKEKGTNQ